MFTRLKASSALPFIIFAAVILISYWQIYLGFFQQDEWLGFARSILLKDEDILGLIKYAFAPSGGHYIPLGLLSVFMAFSLIKLNYIIYASISILLHIINTFLVYVLAKTLTSRHNFAFVTALIFSIMAAGFQATAWVVADIPTHSSAAFASLSLIFFLNFLKKESDKLFLLSILSLTFSLLFKELAVGIFAIYTILLLISRAPRKYIILVILLGLSYATFRTWMFTSGSNIPSASQAVQPNRLVYNFLTIPAKAVSQSIVPGGMLHEISYDIAKILPSDITGEKGDPSFEKFVDEKVLEIFSLVIFLLITGFIFLYWRKSKENILTKVAILGFLIAFFNSFIFVFSPESAGAISLISSRNLYFISSGTALILASFFQIIGSKKRIWMFVVIAVFAMNFIWLQKELGVLKERGKERKAILNSIKEFKANLPPEVVFYTESDSSYYGLPDSERIMPFQSGFGQTLLSWYYHSENFPKSLYENRFLWDIGDQGFKKAEGRGFGYFRDFEQMANTVAQNKIPQNSIIGFNYNSNEKIVTEISEEVKERVNGYLTNKRKLDSDSIVATSSHNVKDVQLALDGERQTFWDSKLPYFNPQYFQLDLGSQKVIAQIQIDSYNNKNQDKVGYRVIASNDGKSWIQLFESKILPPNKTGLVNLYFRPTKARYFRIEQIGSHQFASWVIHELSIYEVI